MQIFQLISALSTQKTTLNVYFEPQDFDSTGFFKSQLTPLLSTTTLGSRVQLRLVPFGRAQCENVGRDYV